MEKKKCEVGDILIEFTAENHYYYGPEKTLWIYRVSEIGKSSATLKVLFSPLIMEGEDVCVSISEVQYYRAEHSPYLTWGKQRDNLSEAEKKWQRIVL